MSTRTAPTAWHGRRGMQQQQLIGDGVQQAQMAKTMDNSRELLSFKFFYTTFNAYFSIYLTDPEKRVEDNRQST
jgi:hypothetical protein